MPITVGILTFMSMINVMLSSVEHEKFYNLGMLYEAQVMYIGYLSHFHFQFYSDLTCKGLVSCQPIIFFHSPSDLSRLTNAVSQRRTHPPASTVTKPSLPVPASNILESEILNSHEA